MGADEPHEWRRRFSFERCQPDCLREAPAASNARARKYILIAFFVGCAGFLASTLGRVCIAAARGTSDGSRTDVARACGFQNAAQQSSMQ